MELDSRYYQLNQPVRGEPITIGTTSVNISRRRPLQNPRQVYTIRNTGATTITIVFGGDAAVATYGQILMAGETMTDSSDSGYICYQDNISAISSAAGGQVTIMER